MKRKLENHIAVVRSALRRNENPTRLAACILLVVCSLVLVTPIHAQPNDPLGVQGVEIDPADPGIKTGIVVANFGRKKKGCIKGFGICKLFPRKKIGLKEAQVLAVAPHEGYYAEFRLDGLELTIVFLEPIPHYREKFFVDPAKPPFEPVYKDLLGHTYIKPVVGVYRVDDRIGPFGGVRIKVEKGEKRK